jgi:hypothetical protein
MHDGVSRERNSGSAPKGCRCTTKDDRCDTRAISPRMIRREDRILRKSNCLSLETNRYRPRIRRLPSGEAGGATGKTPRFPCSS